MTIDYQVITCKCGREFMTKEEDLKACPACKRKELGEKRPKLQERICERCKSVFHCMPKIKRHYCIPCWHLVREIRVECPTCHKIFVTLKKHPRKYCSSSCIIQHTWGDHNRRCESCGARLRGGIHGQKPTQKLCVACHDLKMAKKRRDEYLAKLARNEGNHLEGMHACACGMLIRKRKRFCFACVLERKGMSRARNHAGSRADKR